MKKIMILILSITIGYLTGCTQNSNSGRNDMVRTIRVPADYPDIATAVKNSSDGDMIILAPGKYMEMKIDLDKKVTISSEWKISGDQSKIEETIIDSQDSILFNIKADSVEISGLKIINGDHPLNITAKAIIKNNHFIGNLDAMSFEASGGGYAGYNTVENDRDDGLDLDIRKGGNNHGSDIVVEYNTIINSNDDGIEIRLYDYPDQNIKYEIRNNRISGSKNAGIQVISYDIFTGKMFWVHHNIISGCKTGFACMEGENTREDMTGATTMDEMIYLYNNNLIENQVGATGGNSMIAMNNIVMNNALGGFKKFGKNSLIIKNLFYQNGGRDFVEIDKAVKQQDNIISSDPMLDKVSFLPVQGSPCIDAGQKKVEPSNGPVMEIPAEYISGPVPDIGAIEKIN